MDKDSGNTPQEVATKRQITVSQVLPFVAIGVFILLCAYYFHQLVEHKWGIDQEKLGQFGDFVGGILNPLVAMFALIAVVVSVGLQKTVLDETRKELKVTQEIAIEQAKTADQQRREQRFFDLLDLYQRTVDSLIHTVELHNNFVNFQGKSAIAQWLRESNSGKEFLNFQTQGFHSRPASQNGSQWTMASSFSASQLNSAWESEELANFIDQYFRVVYRILSEAEPLLGEDHFRYVKLLRAQLNRNELTLLAYNMWLDIEGVKMRPLAAKYGLLKHLPEGKLREEIEKILPPGVFGK